MATSQPTETQVEGEIDVDEAVKEILAEMEAEEQDPLEGMGNAQIAEGLPPDEAGGPAPVQAIQEVS